MGVLYNLINPVIKWSGSKRSQAKCIVDLFPKKIDTFYEPFVGGGSITYQLLSTYDIEVSNIVCSDINDDLIRLWNAIKVAPKTLAERYAEMWEGLNIDNDLDRKKSYFNDVRSRFNKTREPADFLFISRTTVNGKIRYNKNGEFNNTFHVTRNGIMPDKMKDILFDWSDKIQSVTFICQDYRSIKSTEKDFLYLDPPYAGTNDLYYGGIELDPLWAWMRNQKCGYVLSFDGTVGDTNRTHDIPEDLYSKHIYLNSGLSGFKRLQEKKIEVVLESVYVK